jgi:roadblock/LC7 domain-containing protein
MIGLDRIMKKPGVIAVGQFDENGKIGRAVGDIPEEPMRLIAEWCAQKTVNFEENINEFSEKIGMDWNPLTGWMVWGGRYAVFVVHSTGVIIETKKADFNQLMVDLFLPEPTGGKPMLSGL